MTQHTPGPWAIKNGRCIYGSGDFIKPFVASVEDDHNDAETVANARLISSAPDLLNACLCALADLEGLLETDCFSTDDPAYLTIQELRAAITKATGDAT